MRGRIVWLLAGAATGCGGASRDVVDLSAHAPLVAYSSGAVPCEPAAGVVCRARPLGPGDWDDCPFPAAADRAGLDEAAVLLDFLVGASGIPERARVLTDPGYGFGGAAAACGLTHQFQPAQDRDGRPVPSWVRVRIHFTRPPPLRARRRT